LLEKLTLEGITVKFQDASGEEMRFEKALLLNELKREEEPQEETEPEDGNGSDSNGGGGCSAGWGALLSFLALTPVLKTGKRQGK
jgi:hypothetical protein